MAEIIRMVFDNYNEIVESKRNVNVDTWPIMSSPIPVLLIAVIYLYFVLWLGPRLMANRKPFELNKLLVAYNLFQVLYSTWFSVLAFRTGVIQHIMKKGCKPMDIMHDPAHASTIPYVIFCYFCGKVTELLDTVFFVLRKKQNQVTFLHVYHHTFMLVFSWAYLKFLPGEQGIAAQVLNSMVHVVMYTYYMLSAMGPKYQKYLWWKKYMTWIQLFQFVAVLVHMVIMLAMDCHFPRSFSIFTFCFVLVFALLFADFYRKAYKKKNK